MANNNILIRESINNKFADGLLSPLMVINAPMGYGKTTSLKAYLAKSKYTDLWLNMTSAFNIASPEYFWMILCNAVGSLSDEIKLDFETRGYPSDSAQELRLIDTIRSIMGKSKKKLVVVIDDYHLIENDSINSLICNIAQAEINNLHIIVVSRKVPNIPISEFQAKNLCSMIGYEDLALSHDEMMQYFDLVEFEGDQFEKESLAADANGWISALFLFTQGNGKHHSKNRLNELLKASLFDQYDEESKLNLIKLSFFDSITPKQAAYIFDDYNMAMFLEQLYKANTFISCDQDGKYRLNKVLLDFLRNEQYKYEIDTIEMYKRAGQWYANEGDIMMACTSWLKTEDYDMILKLLEDSDISSINSIDRKLIFEMFNILDKDRWYEYPLATLKYILLLIIFNERKKAAILLKDFDEFFASHEHKRYNKERLLAESEIVKTSLAFNDIHEIVQHAKNAADLFGPSTSKIRHRTTVYLYGCPHFSYLFYKKTGEYKEIINTINDGFLSLIHACDSCCAGAITLANAEYALETGNLDAVPSAVATSLFYSQEYEQTCITIAGLLTLARYYFHIKRAQDFARILNRLEAMKKIEANPLNSNAIDNALGYLYNLTNQPAKTADWILQEKGVLSKPYASVYLGSSFNEIIHQMVLIKQRRFDEYQAQKHTFMLDFQPYHNQLGILYFHIYNSISLMHTENIESALSELQVALQQAEKDHLITCFVENASDIIVMLESGDLNVEKHFLTEVTESCRRAIGLGTVKSSTQLSTREIDIMDLLMKGLTIKGIGYELSISENTVKRHLQNIYRKLNVKNKTLAIQAFVTLKNSVKED